MAVISLEVFSCILSYVQCAFLVFLVLVILVRSKRHQFEFQMLCINYNRLQQNLLQWWNWCCWKLFDLSHLNAKAPSLFSWLCWCWYDHILPSVRKVEQGFCCTSTKDLYSMGPCKEIMESHCLLLAVIMWEFSVPFCYMVLCHLCLTYNWDMWHLLHWLLMYSNLLWGPHQAGSMRTLLNICWWLSRVSLVIHSTSSKFK